MGVNSKIEWTDHTFNPWIGCTKVSAGCTNCYAEAMMDKRLGRVEWGDLGTRSRTSAAYWKKPLAWNKKLMSKCRAGCGWRGDLDTAHIDEERWHRCPACGSKTVPTRARVFCASLADVFEDRDELVPWRDDLFALIDATPHLDWLLLTKRPENVEKMWPMHTFEDNVSFRGNVWLGTSVENQEQADMRIPELLKILVPVRFLSCEPLLDEVDLFNVDGDISVAMGERGTPLFPADVIDWVIVGGESGHNARRFDLSWACTIVEDCEDVGVPVFVKQFGENPECVPCGYTITGKGGDWNEWPLELRVRQFPVGA